MVLIHSTRSGRTFRLDPHVWMAMKSKNFSTIKPGHLRKLADAKIVVADDEDELSEVLQENKSSRDTGVLYLPMQHQAQCQLGCVYCGQKHSNAKMDNDTRERLYRLVEEKLSSGNMTKLATAWFGSEPLLGKGMLLEMSRRFKDITSRLSKGYQSKIVTNGLLLKASDYKLLTEDCHIRQVEVTIDGLRENHDKRRVFKNGKTGSFEAIWANVLSWAQCIDPAYDQFNIRCNVDSYNIGDVEHLINRLADHNLQDKITFYTAPVHNWGNEAARRSDRMLYAQYELDWIVQMNELGFRTNVLPGRKRSLCMATNKNSILVAPDGDIYGCTEVSLVPAYNDDQGRNRHAIMNLAHEGDPFAAKEMSEFSQFPDEVGKGKWSCSTCNLFPVCGGSCPKEWLEGAVPCPSFKDNFKERLIIDYMNRKAEYLSDYQKHG